MILWLGRLSGLSCAGWSGTCRAGRHHFLSHFTNLELKTNLVWENVVMFVLEGCRGLVGRKDSVLLEQFHDKLSPGV